MAVVALRTLKDLMAPVQNPTLPTDAPDAELPSHGRRPVAAISAPVRAMCVYLGVLTAMFSLTLVSLVAHALESSLNSHIPLIPFVAGYLLYLHARTSTVPSRRSVPGAAVFASIGIAALGLAFRMAGLSANDQLALMTAGYVSFAIAGGFLFLGAPWMRDAGFAIAVLAFMIPLPERAVVALEDLSVLASADVSAWMLQATGTPLLRDGTTFTIPGIVLRVAQECSGIRSSWVLLITSLIASQLFLKRPLHRLLLVAFVIPLGIIRNGFRILVIALLCVHVGPHMIDSVIHHQGGPFFFALSLVPLFLLLWWLRWREEQPQKLAGRRP